MGISQILIFTGHYWKLRKANTLIDQLNEEKQQLRTKGQQVWEENQRLAKWKPIINAEDKAKEILKTAQDKVDRALQEIEKRQATSKQEADELVTNAATEAGSILAKATTEATEKLSGIKSESDRLTAVAKAMKNKIEGYGDEYLIPGVGLLDELADDFGNTEAGQKLKEYRLLVKETMKSGRAAECDYAEANRKETAIAFVADAFNGKVEEILSRVRHDNYGILAQEIRDAAILVNRNGEAFRNARIAESYVGLRLDELKWATIVHELRQKDREEQKEIRDRMREEAKAQREIEKARKEAEKEETVARKAYDEMMKKFEAMTAEQKALHAKEMEQMQERLKAAEENKRTISLAEQTKVGNVYIISNIGSFGENVYKIGMTRRLDPQDRVDELGDASVPFPFDVHAFIKSENAPELEHRLHKIFLMNQVNKMNHRKEFFRVPLAEIKRIVESTGASTHWTLTAEAAQYRETLRIEERIVQDPAYRRQWENRQVQLEDEEDRLPSDELPSEE